MTTSIKNQTTINKPQIQIKRVYKHSISKIWTALTTKEALSEWLMETTNFNTKLGQQFQFKTKPQGGFDGIIHCEILAIEPPNIISYSWQSNDMKSPTIVTWNLTQLSANETVVKLSHNGFEGVSGWITKQILNFGWKKILSKKLKNHLAL